MPASSTERTHFFVRPATPDDAETAAGVLRTAFAKLADIFPEAASITAAEFNVLTQTGRAFLVAVTGEETDEAVVGVVRHWDEEGIAGFDMLAATDVGAGRALVRAIEQRAQDKGTRLVRTEVPQKSSLGNYFGMRGYMPIAQVTLDIDGNKVPFLRLERRLPLLTVRDQRREDAAIIGELTGEDPWMFEMNPRPGAFVAADGDDVVGFVQSKDGGAGISVVSEPLLFAEYEGRGLDVWMIERAATYAETNGAHTVELSATPRMDTVGRALEDRGWSRDGAGRDARYLRRARTVPDNFSERP
jgi:GNAT superfamily N-acetyltransferase